MRNYITAAAIMTLPIMAMAQASTAPAEVTGLSATAGAGFIDIKWDEATPAAGTVITGYHVYWGSESVDSEDKEYPNLEKASFNSFTLRGLEPGNTYYMAVTALCDVPDCESETWSPEASATITAPAVDTPAEPEITAEPPVVLGAQHSAADMVMVTFDTAVTVTPGAENFLVENRTTGEKIRVAMTEVDGKNVTLTMAEGGIKSGDRYSVTAASSVKSGDGTAVQSGNKNSIRFTAKQFGKEMPVETIKTPEPVVEAPVVKAPEPVIETPKVVKPEAPTALKVSLDQLSVTGMAELTWTPATGDSVMDQVIYVKEGTGEWEQPQYAGKAANRAAIQVGFDTSYQVRVVSLAADGTESEPIDVSFATPTSEVYVDPTGGVEPEMLEAALPQTGPDTSMWMLLMIMVGGIAVSGRAREE